MTDQATLPDLRILLIIDLLMVHLSLFVSTTSTALLYQSSRLSSLHYSYRLPQLCFTTRVRDSSPPAAPRLQRQSSDHTSTKRSGKLVQARQARGRRCVRATSTAATCATQSVRARSDGDPGIGHTRTRCWRIRDSPGTVRNDGGRADCLGRGCHSAAIRNGGARCRIDELV